MTHFALRALLFLALVVAAACGGIAIIDPDAGSGGATSTSVVTTSVGTTVSTSSGWQLCTEHADCGSDLCVFSLGICAEACASDACDPCSVGTVCEPCATSSCPTCKDCASACMLADGRCDENDPCPGGKACVFEWLFCAETCSSDTDCDDGFSFCDECATGSCCGCEDCVAVCMGGE
jgi:hypothetical protein